MNKQEIKDKIAKMECEIKNLKDEINKQEEPERRWKPKLGDIYYLIDGDGEVLCSHWDNIAIDRDRYALGNCFKTREEAEFVVEQLKVLVELKEYADDDKKWNCSNAHWCIAYDADEGCIDNDGCYHNIISAPFNIYFSSKEQAQKAIDAIGKERLKKYYFCVED